MFCADIDECLTMKCMKGAKCVNKFGSYFCECFDGFELSSFTKFCDGYSNDLFACTLSHSDITLYIIIKALKNILLL